MMKFFSTENYVGDICEIVIHMHANSMEIRDTLVNISYTTFINP